MASSQIYNENMNEQKSEPIIEIAVQTDYLSELSNPEERHFVFTYTITISNKGDCGARLKKRHWVITDSDGTVEEVRGLGVVGQNPVLLPGETFEYTSGCALPSSFGTMKGTYEMVTDSGVSFKADIPEFILSAPRTLH